MSQSIAFIGVGNMGCPMAENLMKAGKSVKVFDGRVNSPSSSILAPIWVLTDISKFVACKTNFAPMAFIRIFERMGRGDGYKYNWHFLNL